VPNVQNGSQNMLSTVPLLSTTSRGSARSWTLCPISFESVVFKLGAKTSAGHQCQAPSLDAALEVTIVLLSLFLSQRDQENPLYISFYFLSLLYEAFQLLRSNDVYVEPKTQEIVIFNM
jgi:hypothetical protein